MSSSLPLVACTILKFKIDTSLKIQHQLSTGDIKMSKWQVQKSDASQNDVPISNAFSPNTSEHEEDGDYTISDIMDINRESFALGTKSPSDSCNIPHFPRTG